MLEFVKRITNLGIVSRILQGSSSYPSIGGFCCDRKKLASDRRRVVRTLNKNLMAYSRDKKN